MLSKLQNYKTIALDCETTSESGKKADNLHFKKCGLETIAFATEDLCFYLTKDTIDVEKLKEIMENPDIKKIGHNLKFDCKVLKGVFDIDVKGLYFDTSIASKLLDEEQIAKLKPLAKTILKREWGEWKNFKSYIKQTLGKTMAKCTEEELFEAKPKYYAALGKYNQEDARATWDLAKIFYKRLKRTGLWNLFSLEMEVERVFYKAEVKGMELDIPHLQSLSHIYNRHVKRLQKCIWEKTRIAMLENVVAAKSPHEVKKEDYEFNINSAQQLGDVLFNVFGLPVQETTDTGAPKTGKKTLDALANLEGNNLARWIKVYKHWEMLDRHINKLIKESICGTIYTNFNTLGTKTGRFTSKEPNLQQVPSGSKESQAIRSAFKGDLIVADYSNMELRLLAHFSRDTRLLDIYKKGGDLHQVTADLLGIDRDSAKTINFGISYGIGPNKLSDKLRISKELAKEFIDTWYATYSAVQSWKYSVIDFVMKYNYSKTILGRRRRIDIASMSKYDRWGAERELVNFVIQGTGADIVKLAILKLKDADIRLQIHDELVIVKDCNTTADKVKQLMESIGKDLNIRVPLTVDVHHCTNWGEAK